MAGVFSDIGIFVGFWIGMSHPNDGGSVIFSVQFIPVEIERFAVGEGVDTMLLVDGMDPLAQANEFASRG